MGRVRMCLSQSRNPGCHVVGGYSLHDDWMFVHPTPVQIPLRKWQCMLAVLSLRVASVILKLSLARTKRVNRSAGNF
jgi:hypothetical protein